MNNETPKAHFKDVAVPGNDNQELGLSDRLRRAADEYDRICRDNADLIDEHPGWLDDWSETVDDVEGQLLSLLEEPAAPAGVSADE